MRTPPIIFDRTALRFLKNKENLKSCEKGLTLALNGCIINNVKSVMTF